MTTSFAGVTLPNASKIVEEPIIAISDELLLSGKHSVQTNTNLGFVASYRCFGTWAQYLTVLALVGTSGTLITRTTPSGYTKCYISYLKPIESDNPEMFHFDVSFKRDTT